MPRLAALVANSPAVAEDLVGLLESGAFGLDVSRHRLDFKLKAPPDHIDQIHERAALDLAPTGRRHGFRQIRGSTARGTRCA